MFRDPLASPAYYTKSLLINCPYAFSGINTEGCRWISTFCHVVEFEVDARKANIDESSAIPFVLFHGFSPAVEVFAATFTPSSTSRILNLVHSFPFLKDLILVTCRPTGDDHGRPAATQPSNPPAFTGTLGIFPEAGMEHIASQLLSLPNGLHFRELQLEWCEFDTEQDLLMTTMLVERCQSTLEFLNIFCTFSGTFIRHPRLCQ